MLFLCADDQGLLVFDLLDNGLVGNLIEQDRGVAAWDVIPLENQNELIVFGKGSAGIYQYDYTDAGALTAKSHLEICN